ncbi:hypothetical protein R4Z10_01650 [Niallia sp. XMNu-256]|uniref:hypothetical protein n=1 Tax=Niallia sp. XMNu-256 TaxID=3082444 RepID=UPI0030D034E4
MNNTDRLILLMPAGIIAGYALIKVPLNLTFLSGMAPVTQTIGVLAILICSLYLIYKGIRAIAGK